MLTDTCQNITSVVLPTRAVKMINPILSGGDKEYGFVTLGAVECWGIDPDYNPEEDDYYDPYALFGVL